MPPFVFGIPAEECECGCRRRAKAGRRFAAGHSPAKSQNVKEEAFWRNMVIRPDGCWVWQAYLNDWGYGTVADVRPAAQKTMRAHGLAYELIFGKIPKELEFDHTCKNRACINPWHLEPVTHFENMRRSSNAKITNEQVAEIKAAPRSDVGRLPEKYGISKHLVATIRYRKRPT